MAVCRIWTREPSQQEVKGWIPTVKEFFKSPPSHQVMAVCRIWTREPSQHEVKGWIPTVKEFLRSPPKSSSNGCMQDMD
ncbi:hypothetical protein DPMN_147141 [Dreissena polymorpha]|uniref:Uncharacterized protein n=1 Tax=Dreissena polymorpha TaxID=45954 RepID=A0A9D4J327_DREPO|nr:hypothetical protein DPMN_147141 [Dreissena polymorpha]